MNEVQSWSFTCKTCGGHQLTVTRFWSILAGPVRESWQEWGPLGADHHWHYEFKEKVEESPDDEGERGDYGLPVEHDSAFASQEYDLFSPSGGPENEEVYVNCESCDRKIEFAWSEPGQAGQIIPMDCSEYLPQ